MKISIDNKKISTQQITFNSGLNFNRFFDNLKINNYELQVSKSYFLEKLTVLYTTTRNEIKTDDELNNDSSDFKEVNYCSLLELLKYPNYLKEIFETYLKDVFFKELINTKAEYVINSIDTIEVSETIIIKGKTFKI